MRKPIYWIWVTVLVAVAVLPVVYVARRWTDPLLRDSAMANWFATMCGVIVGIPIALELNRRQQRAADRRAQEILKEETRERGSKILRLLQTELTANLDLMKARRSDPGQKRVVITERLKDDLWSAFSASGDLQWISNPDVLDALPTAYYQIRVVIFLEHRYFDAAHFPGLRTANPEGTILTYLDKGDAKVLEKISRGIAVIDEELDRTAA